MALDVHLSRDVNELWGFELVGGSDDEMPLTIEEIQPSSPATRAGLQRGDTILTINGEEAFDFTHEEACRKVAECEDTMIIGVMRGLYNLVLDDQEPIYYEQGDLDPQSQPTEVPFKIQQFVEPEDLGSTLIDYGTNDDPLGTPFDPSVLLTENRSLTASPFVTPNKPYRPFSTEPIPEVPGLEDPIILNPDYRDQFGKTPVDIIPDYILNGDGAIESKFKLPISEQYDPDGTKHFKNAEIDSVLSKYVKMETLSKKSVTTDKRITKTAVKDVKITENTSKDVKIGEIVNLNSKDSLIQDIKSKKCLSKDVNESLKVTAEDVSIKEEFTSKRESFKTDVKVTEKHEIITEAKDEEIIKNELMYIEKNKQDIDVSQIEETALTIVDDSIERAVSVAEEIKKEIEEEMTTELDIKTSQIESKEKEKTAKSETKMKKIVELVESEIKSQSEETAENINITSESAIKSEENIEDAEKRVVKKDVKATTEEEEISKKVTKKDTKAFESIKQYEENVVKEKPTRKESVYEYSDNKYENKRNFSKVTKTVTSGAQSDNTNAQQRTYAIGLQTIPNIRGVVHSSHHYDLLLKTFFLHLTDVMVALSRFVLTQPIFNTESTETNRTAFKTQMNESEVKDVRYTQQEVEESIKRVDKQFEAKERRVEDKKEAMSVAGQAKKQEIKAVSRKTDQQLQVQETKIEKRQLVTPVPEEIKTEYHESVQKATVKREIKSDSKNSENVVIKKEKDDAIVIKAEQSKISGAQMAQRTEKKVTKEVTQKMDAVISEFQTIAVEEDKNEMLQRNRRSRSRSQIEEEVAKESDPLEWLSKVDSRRASQEISEERLSKKEYSSSKTVERKQYEKLEKQEIKHNKSKKPKQMYVAVVEAHVYTNKDVIFEDAEEFSETSSVQSAEEINTAFEAIETMSTENVALESAVQQIEQAKIVEESQQLVSASAQSAATVRNIEEVVQQSTNIKQAKYKQETALQKSDIQEVVIEESKEIIEPILEIKETIKKESATVDINQSLTVAESSEINIHESKSEYTSVECKKESIAVVEEDYREKAVVESRSEIVQTNIKEVKPEVQVEEVSAKFVIKSEKADIKKEEEFAALKIIKEVETEIESINEIIEIEEEIDVSNINQETIINKIEMSQALVLDESNVVTERKTTSSEIGLAKSKIDISTSNQIETKNYQSESHISEDFIQESSFTARAVDKKLTIRTDLNSQKSIESPSSTIDTPTPSTVPPTPLTDEYVFALTIPLPKSRGTTPVPRDCTPEDEDPHIVKKKLIPHIETTIEKTVYDPPLPTPPPGGKLQSPIFKTPGLFGGESRPIYKIKFPPVYRKPGLFGGADNPEYSKEEIREIERKSSLLASAIDQTIKSIEEYKEEVGMEKKKQVNVTEFKENRVEKSYQESYKEEIVMESKQNGFEETNTTIEEIIETTGQIITNNNNTEDKNVIIEEYTTKEVDERSSSAESATTVSEIEITKDIIETNAEVNSKIDNIQTHDTPIENTYTKPKMSEMIFTKIEKNEIDNETTIEESSETRAEVEVEEEKSEKDDPLLRVRPVVFDPESIQKRGNQYIVTQPSMTEARQSPYLTETGEIIGTIQGIVDGLEEPVMDAEVAKEIGKPGISEQKIAELISGEAEMLREAHVMGLSRVLTSHMHRTDDCSVDFQKIKPMIGSLKDSEVLKALNEELERQKEEERKKEEKKWTTFLQKPKRPVPKVKFGYHGWTEAEQALVAEPYKVKIVKQSKPKVAPDYKPEDFDTGPLPWEQRAEIESSLPPVEAEEPILIPELPEFLEAVDPLKESEVPDLEDSGLPLPPPKEPTPPPEVEQIEEEPLEEEQPEVQEEEVIEEDRVEEESREDMENQIADQLVRSVQGMVDPNASVDQQLSQMRAQLAALAQLPEVIQKTLALVSQQLNNMSQQEARVEISESHTENQSYQEMEVTQNHITATQEIQATENIETVQNHDTINEEEEEEKVTIEEQEKVEIEQQKQQESMRIETQTPLMTEEDMKMEKMKKEQQNQARLNSEARQLKQRSTPRVGKPKRMFGPPDPDNRPVVLPGGRRWRKTSDVYNEQMFTETLQAQAELIQGKTMGFESDLLPYDNRINFMKYEKPPVSLDHLQNSATYKMVHDMDQAPLKRVELLTPVIAEADYRERCRSTTPSGDKKHMQIPQQFHP